MKEKEFYRRIILTAVIVIVSVLFIIKFDSVVGFVKAILKAVSPLITGVIIAFVLNVIMTKIEKFIISKNNGVRARWVRPVSVLCTYLLFILVIIILSAIIIPQLWNSMIMLANNLPVYITTIVNLVNRILGEMGLDARISLTDIFSVPLSEVGPNLAEWIKELMPTISSWISTIDPAVVTDIGAYMVQFFGVIFNIILSIMFSVYLLLSKEKFLEQAKNIFAAFINEKLALKIRTLIKKATVVFSDFVSGQLTEMLILGTLFFVVLSISGMPYALLIATVIAITSIIPYFGTTIAMVFGAILILADSGLFRMIAFVVEFLVIQQIENNFIYPHVVGHSVGLPAIWVLVAVAVFGSLFGISGLIAGVPMMALIYTLVQERVREKLNAPAEVRKE